MTKKFFQGADSEKLPKDTGLSSENISQIKQKSCFGYFALTRLGFVKNLCRSGLLTVDVLASFTNENLIVFQSAAVKQLIDNKVISVEQALKLKLTQLERITESSTFKLLNAKEISLSNAVQKELPQTCNSADPHGRIATFGTSLTH
jgi:hypothetical protein